MSPSGTVLRVRSRGYAEVMPRWALPAVIGVIFFGGAVVRSLPSEKRDVKAAVEAFADAGGDRERTCELVTRDNRAELERLARLTGGRTCADALKLVDSDPGDVSLEDVEVDGDKATVQETLTATTFTLYREGGEWRVDMLALAHLGWTLRQSVACSQLAADVGELGEPQGRKELLAYLGRFERLVERWAREAERIDPARLYAKRHRDLMESIAGIQRALKELRADLASRDRSGYDRAVQKLEKAEQSIQDQPISCAVGA